MATIYSISVTLDPRGELEIQRDMPLAQSDYIWSTSADAGASWQSFALPEAGLHSTDADPALLYRVQDFTQEFFSPLSHESIFSFRREMNADGTATITLHNPDTDRNTESEISVTLDLNDAFSWQSQRQEISLRSQRESALGDDGFESFSHFTRSQSGDLTPTISGINDVGDQRVWESKYAFVSPTVPGRENERFTVYDDGRLRADYDEPLGSYLTESFAYRTAPLNVVRWEDLGDNAAWHSRTASYHEGRLVTNDIRADDGTATIHNHISETTVQTDMIDFNDVHDWDSATYSRSNGLRTEYQRRFDDGTSEYRSYEYDAGVLTRVVAQDGDGTLRETGYAEGIRTGYLYRDANDAHSWTQKLMQRDGASEVRQVVYDNGIEQLTELWDGNVSGVVREDTADMRPWTSITTFYENGLRSESITVGDNGTQAVTSFAVNGEGDALVSSRNITVSESSADQFSWLEINLNFDEAGSIAARSVDYADGRLRQDIFSDAQLVWRSWTDRGDVYDWYQIDEVWDGGQRVSRDFIYDDEIA